MRLNQNLSINDEFLAFLPIYDVIVQFFNKHNVPYKNNMVGFAGDGANSMMGIKHSVKTLLKTIFLL